MTAAGCYFLILLLASRAKAGNADAGFEIMIAKQSSETRKAPNLH